MDNNSYLNVLENMKISEKKTIPIMTKFEYARVIGTRATQLSSGASPLVDTSDCNDCIEIAEKELKNKQFPFIIRRRLPNNIYEDWQIKDLLLPV